MNKIRLAKFIADTGTASRRAAEQLIQDGAVTVNGMIVETPIFFVTGDEDIRILGKQVSSKTESCLYAFHKPINTMTTASDPGDRKTIYDVLPTKYKNLKYVGRLDFKTTGLLLMTNDGEWARKLTLPKSNIPRVYIATVSGTDFSKLELACNGITIDRINYRPMKIDILPGNQLRVTITEGKKNEVRIVLAACGLPVRTLHRISYGNISLGNLSSGEIIKVQQKRIDLLLKSF